MALFDTDDLIEDNFDEWKKNQTKKMDDRKKYNKNVKPLLIKILAKRKYTIKELDRILDNHYLNQYPDLSYDLDMIKNISDDLINEINTITDMQYNNEIDILFKDMISKYGYTPVYIVSVFRIVKDKIQLIINKYSFLT